MKKVTLVVVVVALLVALTAGIAIARTFVCTTNPCIGTNNPDQIGERNGSVADDIRARGGADQVNAARAGNDTDEVLGDGGNDTINVRDGDDRDRVNCGAGAEDVAIIDVGDVATPSCEDIREPVPPPLLPRLPRQSQSSNTSSD